MDIALQERTALRIYISGRGYMSRRRIKRVARRNRRVAQCGGQFRALVFRKEREADAISLQILVIERLRDGSLRIEGRLLDGSSFVGNYVVKTATGYIDVTPAAS